MQCTTQTPTHSISPPGYISNISTQNSLTGVHRARDLGSVGVRAGDAGDLEDGVDDTSDALSGDETGGDCEAIWKGRSRLV